MFDKIELISTQVIQINKLRTWNEHLSFNFNLKWTNILKFYKKVNG